VAASVPLESVQRVQSVPETAAQARLEFVAALEDDFHTPRALEALDHLAGRVCGSTEKAGLVQTLRELAKVLGLRLQKGD
jgi:cysteinyl-tRNA synthetase